LGTLGSENGQLLTARWVQQARLGARPKEKGGRRKAVWEVAPSLLGDRRPCLLSKASWAHGPSWAWPVVSILLSSP